MFCIKERAVHTTISIFCLQMEYDDIAYIKKGREKEYMREYNASYIRFGTSVRTKRQRSSRDAKAVGMQPYRWYDEAADQC